MNSPSESGQNRSPSSHPSKSRINKELSNKKRKENMKTARRILEVQERKLKRGKKRKSMTKNRQDKI